MDFLIFWRGLNTVLIWRGLPEALYGEAHDAWVSARESELGHQ